MNEPVQTVENHNRLGQFVRGNKANPKGQNGYTTVKIIEKALNKKAKQRGFKNFPMYVAERALVNDQVLIAVLKKLIPDQLEGKGFESKLTSIFVNIKELSASNS